MIKQRIYILLLIFLPGTMLGQNARKYSNEFLSIGVGARAFAMGNTTIASVKGETSAYWNPSALIRLEHPINLGLMHSEYFAGLSQYDFGALAFKIDKQSAFSMSFIRFGVDNIPNTLQLIDENGSIRFDRIKSFSVADYAFSLSYARKMKLDGLSVGGSAKIIRRVGGDFASAWGFGIDVSALYEYERWSFAAVTRDVTTTYNAWTFNTSELEEVFKLTGNVIPTNSTEITLPKLILGTAYDYPFARKFGCLVEINLDVSTDGKRNVLIKGDPFSIDPHMGFEFYYNKLVFIRGGVGNIQQEPDFQKETITTMQPNIGMGIHYKRFKIDYALTDVGNVSAAGYSHVFSMSYSIKESGKKY